MVVVILAVLIYSQIGSKGGTTLQFPRPLNQVDDSSSLDELTGQSVDIVLRQDVSAVKIDPFFVRARQKVE